MRTLFVDPPSMVEDWLAQRRALGQDRFDEVWEGEYHVAPAPTGRHAELQFQLAALLRPYAQAVGMSLVGPTNIGVPTDYRVPDAAAFREWTDRVWYPSAAIVVEILSPGDESRAKLPFYHRAGVEEVLIVDADGRTVEWLARGPEAFEPADGSALLGITAHALAALIAWPR